MEINEQKLNQELGSTAGATTENSADPRGGMDAVSSGDFLDFAAFTGNLLNTNTVNIKDVEEFKKNITEILDSRFEAYDPRILHITPATPGINASYHYIVISIMQSNTVVYGAIALAATGEAGMKPSELLTALSQDARIVLPGIALNDILEAYIATQLSNIYPNSKIYNMDGLVLQADVDLTDKSVAIYAASEIINTGITFLAKVFDKFTESSFLQYVKAQNVKLYANQAFNTEPVTSPSGSVEYRTWEITVTPVNSKKALRANEETGGKSVLSVAGNIQLFPFDELNPQTHAVERKFAPAVVMNSAQLSLPSTGMALYSIYAASQMLTDMRWVTALAANIKKGKDPGALNKLRVDPNGKPMKAIDFTTGLSKEEKEVGIQKLITGNPLFIYDAPEFEIGTNPFADIIDAANGDSAARNAVIQAAHEFFNGNFPIDYSPDAIFINESMVIPYGYFIGKKGQKISTDEIDILYVLNLAGNKASKLLNKYIQATLGGASQEILMLEFLAELGLNVTITGHKQRMIFDPRFIKTLATAAFKSGIAIQMPKSDVAMMVSNDYGYLTGMIGNAGIGGLTSYTGGAASGPGYYIHNNLMV